MPDSPKERRGHGAATVTPDSYAAEPIKYRSLQIVDLAAEAAAVSDAYRNLVICRVNRSCLRLAVFDDVFRWHSHPESDELFLVVGTIHRTRAVGRTVNLCFEDLSADTVFTEGTNSQDVVGT